MLSSKVLKLNAYSHDITFQWLLNTVNCLGNKLKILINLTAWHKEVNKFLEKNFIFSNSRDFVIGDKEAQMFNNSPAWSSFQLF